MLTGIFQNLEGECGKLGYEHMLMLYFLFEPPHLLLKSTKKEHKPWLPVGIVSAESLLGLPQGKIIPLFAVFDHAFKRAIRSIGIAAAK